MVTTPPPVNPSASWELGAAGAGLGSTDTPRGSGIVVVAVVVVVVVGGVVVVAAGSVVKAGSVDATEVSATDSLFAEHEATTTANATNIKSLDIASM